MKTARSLFLILGMSLLILDSGTALQGAKEGLMLCVSAVIPSLLPFWVLSALLTRSLWGSCGRVSTFLGRLFSIPTGAESLLVPAFLGGYPAGAGCIGSAYQEGRLEKEQAQRLLGYCSNVGPAFLFGIVAPQLNSFVDSLFLWGLQVLGAWTASWLLPGRETGRASIGSPKRSDLLGDAVTSMGKICVCVILFRVLLRFSGKIIPEDWAAGVILSGIAELTNGCCQLRLLPAAARLPAAAGLTALGGVCVALQTASVTQGLDLRMYALGKAIACLTAVLGAWCPWCLAMIPMLRFLQSRKYGLPRKGCSPRQKRKARPKRA